MKVPEDFDFTKRHVEQTEELEGVAWAENNGWTVRKLKYEGRVGAPDRLFYGYGTMVLIEMKNPKRRNHKNGGLSEGQVEEHKRFLDAGVPVAVCYTKQEVIDTLTPHMERQNDSDFIL